MVARPVAENRMTDAPDAPVAVRTRRSALLREAGMLLLALAGVAIAGRLAVWQFDRAAQKLAMQASLDARGAEPLLAAPALARGASEVPAEVDRRALVTGRWLGERTLYLDNRQMDGKVGFYVVTPMQLDGSADVVLVQRGWVARNFGQRTVLPVVASPPGPVRVEGAIAMAPSRLFEFSGAASGPIRQNLDPSAFARETGLPVLPLVLIERTTPANTGDGLERHWPPPATDVQMHYGYVFQWSAIGVGIAFLYVWFRLVRPRRRPR